MVNDPKRGYSPVVSWIKHPVTQYATRIAIPTAIYGALGYLVSKGLKSAAQSLDENIPKAFQQTQRLDEIIGNALIEKTGSVGRTAIKIDKKVKEIWSNMFGIDEAQQQRNREALGLKEPSYIEVPVKIKTYTTQPSSQPAFHYFEKNADKISDPLITIALGLGLVKGTLSALKKGFRTRRQRKIIDKAVEKSIKAKLKEEPKTYKFGGY